ncbi:MAG TPA: nitrilase-related carbon-nitrogen hydrolase, partial [Polyangia bacterium]|nr:nitrilase-related carbon-nitrogen hydrolase [Polyangia bacterium]
MKIALGQINPTIGDLDGNRRLVWDAALEAERRGAALAIFPELALTGYPPKDLLERPAFLDAARASLDALAAELGARGVRVGVLVGFPERLPPSPSGRGVSNSAALIEGGRVVSVTRKSLLPTYDVFDEWRYFDPATAVGVVPFRGQRLGVTICEDIWNDGDFWPQRLYRADPVEALVAAGVRAGMLVGFPERLPPAAEGRGVANSAALIEGGRVVSVTRKSLLPTYDVFDEWRYFDPATAVSVVPFRGRRLGVTICEDIWNDGDFWPKRLYRADPV